MFLPPPDNIPSGGQRLSSPAENSLVKVPLSVLLVSGKGAISALVHDLKHKDSKMGNIPLQKDDSLRPERNQV